VVGKKAESQNS